MTKRTISKYELQFNLVTPDGKEEFYYGWGKCNEITDIWTFIGWILNETNYMLTFDTLMFYNSIWNDFEKYINTIIETDGIVGTAFDDDKRIYRLKVVKAND